MGDAGNPDPGFLSDYRRWQKPSLQGSVQAAMSALGIIIVCWHLYYAYASPIPRLQHSNIHLGLLLVMFYLVTLDLEPESWQDHVHNAISVILGSGIALATTYVQMNFDRWLNRARPLIEYTQGDLVIGMLIIFIAIHATWRAYGNFLGGVVLFALLYGVVGPYLPSVLFHSGISLERLIYMNTITLDGVYGFILGVGSTWVVIYILFAGLIEGYGGIDYIIELGTRAGSRIASGIVQIAIVSSMLMGSITGSSAANVATTGSFTIPLMQDAGVRGRIAAAIESIASTGGQILPPVMGSAAFLIADILGISFFEVIRAAIIPALLFYLSAGIIVHLSAIKYGWQKDADEVIVEKAADRSSRGRLTIFLRPLPYVTSLAVLVYTLVILRFDPLSAGMYTIFTLMPAVLVRNIVEVGSLTDVLQKWLIQTIDGCRTGAANMAPLTAAIASLGIVVKVLTTTGFTQRFSTQIIGLAGGVFIIVLLLSMLASLLFGMGMPTPAAYVVVAILTAPVLVQLGVRALTAHMFVFYFALLSAITPPVALACAVGAGIAEVRFWDTCVETLRLGLFAFVIPYVFVINPELIHWTEMTPLTFIVVVSGMLTLTMALVGQHVSAGLPGWQRIVYFALAFAIFFVPLYPAQIALGAIAVVMHAARYFYGMRIRTAAAVD